MPPSAEMISPVIALAASLARNATTAATSSGVESRRVGMTPAHYRRRFGSLRRALGEPAAKTPI